MDYADILRVSAAIILGVGAIYLASRDIAEVSSRPQRTTQGE